MAEDYLKSIAYILKFKPLKLTFNQKLTLTMMQIWHTWTKQCNTTWKTYAAHFAHGCCTELAAHVTGYWPIALQTHCEQDAAVSVSTLHQPHNCTLHVPPWSKLQWQAIVKTEKHLKLKYQWYCISHWIWLHPNLILQTESDIHHSSVNAG